MSSTVWSTPASVTPEVRVPRTFWRDTGLALRRQKAAMLGMVLVSLVLVAAVLGFIAIPESANEKITLLGRLAAIVFRAVHRCATDLHYFRIDF